MARFSTVHRLAHSVFPKTVRLDYPGLKIVSHSLTERFIRAHSAKKEPETVKWIESLPKGAVLWDVGANIGAYSLIAAKRGLRVVAIEPSPSTFASLCENIQLNHLEILPLCLMLGEHAGPNHLRLSSTEAGTANHIRNGTGLPMLQMNPAILIRLFRMPIPDFIKIDTDGGEWEILRGLGEYREKLSGILIEAHPQDIHPEGFTLTGQWPIPGFPCENRTYAREAL